MLIVAVSLWLNDQTEERSDSLSLEWATIDDYADYHEFLRTWIKTIVNKFPISNQTALILRVHALRSYLKLICEYELHSLLNKKVSGVKDHGKTTSRSDRPQSPSFV